MTLAMLELPVASALFPHMRPITVKVTNANNFNQAARLAKNYAQRELHIAAPVVVETEHEFAVAMRKQFIAKYAPKIDVRVINGSSPMCFDRRYYMV